MISNYKYFDNHNNKLNDILFYNNKIISVPYDGIEGIKIWNLDTGICEKTLLKHTEKNIKILLYQSNKLISISGYNPLNKYVENDGNDNINFEGINIWNLDTGICEKTIKIKKYIYLTSLLYKNKLIIHYYDKIDIWNIDDNRIEKTLDTENINQIFDILISKDKLLFLDDDNILKTCDLNLYTIETLIELHDTNISNINIYNENKLIYVCDSDETHISVCRCIKIIDLTSKTLDKILEGTFTLITKLYFYKNKVIASTFLGKFGIKIWNLDTGKLEKHITDNITGSIILYGSKLFTCCISYPNNEIKIWDLDSYNIEFIYNNENIHGIFSITHRGYLLTSLYNKNYFNINILTYNPLYDIYKESLFKIKK